MVVAKIGRFDTKRNKLRQALPCTNSVTTKCDSGTGYTKYCLVKNVLVNEACNV